MQTDEVSRRMSTKKEDLQKNEEQIEKSYWQTNLESLYYNIFAFQRARHSDL